MKFLIYDQLTLKNQERKKNVGNKIQLFLSHLCCTKQSSWHPDRQRNWGEIVNVIRFLFIFQDMFWKSYHLDGARITTILCGIKTTIYSPVLLK
jgi:hypothetical protein